MTGRRVQRGVAVVVAILVVALAASTATYLLWQQSLWVRQVENLTARSQADTVARAAANWAAAILAADDPMIDHLGEAWARPMPPFIAENATLSGAIVDEQSKFNVNDLVSEAGPSVQHIVAFQRLLTTLGLPITLVESLVDWLDPDNEVTSPGGAEDGYYLTRDPPYRAPNRDIIDIGELANVKGFNRDIVKRLAPFVTALHEGAPVNVNTAPWQVLQALMPGLGADDAARVVERRQKQPFRSRAEFLQALAKPPTAPTDAQIDVKSRFFRAEVSVKVGRVATAYRALLQRGDRGRTALITLSQVAI